MAFTRSQALEMAQTRSTINTVELITPTNYPPLHPFCRSSVRGYIGKEYEPKMRAARNKLGGKYFVPNMSYNEWIKDVRFNPNVYPADVSVIMP